MLQHASVCFDIVCSLEQEREKLIEDIHAALTTGQNQACDFYKLNYCHKVVNYKSKLFY